MARPKDRVVGFASFKPRFDAEALIDWALVEKAAGTTFSQIQREEIRRCAHEFESAFAMQSQGAQPKLIDGIKQELDDLASSAIQLHQEFTSWVHPEDRTEKQIRRSQAFTIISFAHSNEDSPRAILEEIAEASQRLKSCLNEVPAFSLEKTTMEPMIFGLASFIVEILRDSRAVKARGGTDAYQNKEVFEFRRWGISIGPQSTVFLVFCQALLGEEVTPSKLKVAWGHVRDRVEPIHPQYYALSRS